MSENLQANRREWMKRVLQGAGASVLAGRVSTVPANAAEASAAWKPLFLSAEQNDSLIALGERLIPGSTTAQCNRIIDLILSIESDKNQQDFSRSLRAFDQAATRFHQQPGFHKLVPREQDDLLTSASAEHNALGPAFDVLKEWMADAYWSSQEGLRELGWTGRMAWSKFDGCDHPNLHSSR